MLLAAHGEDEAVRTAMRLLGEFKWRWFLQTVPAPPPNNGVTDTLDEAKAAFKNRYGEVKREMTSIRALAIGLLLVVTAAHAEPIGASDIYIVDGDTIEVPGKRIRLVGFDAPELGSHARCAIEQLLAARATSRLQQIIRIGKTIDLELVDCSWLVGTEVTRLYNYGRACGHLTVDGQDVGDTLIAENLAHPLVCGRYSCPKRQPWCPFKPH